MKVNDRLGIILIAFGGFLIILPYTGLVMGSIIDTVPAEGVWYGWVPRGTQDSPTAVPVGFGFPVQATIRTFFVSPSGIVYWRLPGGCGDYKLSAWIQKVGSSTVVNNITFNSLFNHQSRPELCTTMPPFQWVSGLEPGDYVITWRLAVFDGSTFVGYIENPQKSYVAIAVTPDGYFTINGMRVEPSSKLLIQPPITFVFTATSYPDVITRVKITVSRPGGSTVTEFSLSKTSSTTWQGTWNTNEKGQFIITGDIQTSTNSWQKLSMIIDLGGDVALGITPIQLVGMMSVLAGGYVLLANRWGG